MDKKIPTLAGSLAFFLILNGGSFFFLYIILSGFLPISYNELFLQQIEEGPFKDFLSYFLSYQNNLSYSLFLILSSIYSASSLYYHLMHIAELVGGQVYSFTLSKRFLAITLTLIFLFVLHVLTFVSALLVLNFPGAYLQIILITLLLIFLLMIYAVNATALKTIKFKRIYKGVIFSNIYFLIFTVGFILYLRLFSNFKIVYGVLSFFIIVMFYLYISCIGLILGIYINCKNLDVLSFLKSTQ